MKIALTTDIILLEALSQKFPECSVTTLRSWLKQGRVWVDGSSVKNSKALVKAGQMIEVARSYSQLRGGIKIIYRDKDLIVIDKPEGLLSVAAASPDKPSAHQILKEEFSPKRVYVVHRLDQGTSGLLLFALTVEGMEGLKKALESHTIERKYVAIIEGHPYADAGTWSSYLYEDANYHVHSTDDPERGELAITHFKVMEKSKKRALLELKLETGKKNQIRVHCQDAGHSIVGDKKYGAHTNSIKRLALHAYSLAFGHPVTGKHLQFSSQVPEKFTVHPKEGAK